MRSNSWASRSMGANSKACKERDDQATSTWECLARNAGMADLSGSMARRCSHVIPRRVIADIERSSDRSKLAVGQIGLLGIHAPEDGLANQIFAAHHILGFGNDLGGMVLFDDHHSIVVGENEIAGPDADFPDLDRFSEPFRNPVSDDIGRRRIPAPHWKTDTTDERDIAATSIDDIALDPAALERL